LAIDPGNADVRHSLGLLLVRQNVYTAALNQLRQTSALAPDNARYAYVHTIALNSTGAAAQAIALLERTHWHHPADRDVLVALVSLARDRGEGEAALRDARGLAELFPAGPQFAATVQEFEKRQEL
jgi:predicted Zn-dependent protease